jgi:hypothetical protein
MHKNDVDNLLYQSGLGVTTKIGTVLEYWEITFKNELTGQKILKIQNNKP